jgi:hypothetical protein
MKHLKALGLVALAAVALGGILSVEVASASVLKQTTASGTDTLGVGTEIEITLEPGNSMVAEDAFGFTASTCTGAIIKGKIDRVTPTGQPRGKLSTLDRTGCPHTNDTEANGELEIRNIAGTTNGTVFSSGAKVKTFNTLLNQNCIGNTGGAGTDIGTLTGASAPTAKATIHVNGLIPLEGCSASNVRLTGKMEITKPIGLTIEPSA